ncbi:hypothetical protein BY996DRAFT_6427764 [Phakopsora pachyrhizi]|nr:hypothetical protein BY996DRAFT_6427764 [Phakopsora pachyrhizi]
MLALRKKWALRGRYLGAAGLSWNTLTGYCGHTMLQYSPEGTPFVCSHEPIENKFRVRLAEALHLSKNRTVDAKLLSNETVMDYGVEADMLAIADETGKAIIESPGPVQRRAALERGIKAFLHGGLVSAICADMKWSDPGLKPIDGYYDMGGITTAVGF